MLDALAEADALRGEAERGASSSSSDSEGGDDGEHRGGGKGDRDPYRVLTKAHGTDELEVAIVVEGLVRNVEERVERTMAQVHPPTHRSPPRGRVEGL